MEHLERPCSVCGGKEFEQGEVWAPGANGTVFLAKATKRWQLDRKTIHLEARMCKTCGHVDIFRKLAKK